MLLWLKLTRKRAMLLTALSLGLSTVAAAKELSTAAPLPSGLSAQTTSVAQLLGEQSLRSSGGKELPLIALGAKDAAIRLLLQGGLHGNEPVGSQFVLWLAERYARGESLLNQLGQQVAIDFLPYANPDGDEANTRNNEHGVNLNRNFAVLWGLSRENPGTASFSEAETKAIRSLFDKRHYVAAIDVHGYTNWVVAPSSPEQIKALGYAVTESRVVNYRRWRNAFKAEMPVLPGYQLKTGAGLGDGGAFEDWAFWQQGTFASCLEIESTERFARSYRPDFNHLGDVALAARQAPQIDTFKRYEAFVYRMFVQAIAIKQTPAAPATLAGPLSWPTR